MKRGSILRSLTKLFAAAIAVSCVISLVLGCLTGFKEIRDEASEHSSQAAKMIRDIVIERGGIEAALADSANKTLPIRETLEYLCRGYDLRYIYLFTIDLDENEYLYLIAVSNNKEETDKLMVERGFGTAVTVDEIDQGVLEANNGSEKTRLFRMSNQYGSVIGWAYPLGVDFDGRHVLIGAEYDSGKIYKDMLTRAVIIVVPAAIALIGVSIALLIIMRRKVVAPVVKISEKLRSFSESYGTESEKLEITSDDEIGDIAVSFNKMSDDIHKLIADNTKLTEIQLQTQIQLDVARRIHSGIVPDSLSIKGGGYCVGAFARAAKSVGGDFYDSFTLGDDRVCVVIGDVSGKGITAALFMAMTKTTVREMLRSGMDPAEALNKANDEICGSNPEGLFATVFAAVLDLKDGTVTYANAGHNPPVLLCGEPRFIEVETGIALGVFEDAGIVSEKIKLGGGEGLLLYTDGVTEAVDESDEFYGNDRLLAACKGCTEPDGAVASVSGSVLGFYGERAQFDDLTMISLFYDGFLKMQLKPELSEIGKLTKLVKSYVSESARCKKICLACEEIFTNICSYSGAKDISVCCKGGESFEISFDDDGSAFDPLQPREVKDFEDFDEGGMGISLVKQIADELKYERSGDRNILTLTFKATPHK